MVEFKPRKYVVKEDFCLDRYDEEGDWTGENLEVEEGKVFTVSEDQHLYIAAPPCIRLEADDGTWVEITPEFLAEMFEEQED